MPSGPDYLNKLHHQMLTNWHDLFVNVITYSPSCHLNNKLVKTSLLLLMNNQYKQLIKANFMSMKNLTTNHQLRGAIEQA
jgi:hypothetical protein